MTIQADLMGSGGWWCHTQVHFFLAVKVQEAFCVKKVNLGMLGLILKERRSRMWCPWRRTPTDASQCDCCKARLRGNRELD